MLSICSSKLPDLLIQLKDLVDFAFIHHLLSNTPIILVLYDRKESTAIMGYGLVPRFLTYMDSNLMEVGAVLEKMIQKYEKRKVMEEQKIDSGCGLLVTL